ncbi:hypothetical protein L596_023772 [Steinernema carpocapsae]|uniref:Uncharacterized protein n=1 Tax=Steinernema carpocapsae TaxID=34508 RepID=A0A4U5MEQ5_STECR|nr:hypothetical protein L596_023772 [Steinernema carpocapsae]
MKSRTFHRVPPPRVLPKIMFAAPLDESRLEASRICTRDRRYLRAHASLHRFISVCQQELSSCAAADTRTSSRWLARKSSGRR